MFDIEQFTDELDSLSEKIPKEVFKELNGGILVIPTEKLSEYAADKDLYVMGTYHVSSSMGRYIEIYYGSFEKLYSGLSENYWLKRMDEVLKHELRHHIESLAHEHSKNSLEYDDQIKLKEYLSKNNKI